jgi:hypothetical protein
MIMRAVWMMAASLAAMLAGQGLAAEVAKPATPAGVEAYFTGLKWRNIGPARGGRSISAIGSVKRPNEYWFAAAGGGLWKTTDGGTSWQPMTDG